MNISRGSEWKKWDLHFHTPSSFDYKNKGVTNEGIINTLSSVGISAVAITDHHVMDTERIKKLQHLGIEKGITVFPGIELRSELGGSESIHFIGIFPEDCDVNDIWIKLQGGLGITPADISEKGGDDDIYCDFKDSSRLIHKLGGVVTVHAGKKSNGIENISNNQRYKRALKRDLADGGYIDIFEVGALEDINDYVEIVFPHLSREFPIIICSDNHLIREYSTKSDLWVKADLTFLGLKQATTESRDRIKLGIKPTQLVNFETKKTKIIRSLNVIKKESSKTSDIWFDGCNIELNSGLISIIGNKGNGKSALADILGLMGNSAHNNFEFLNNKKFRHPKNNLSQNFNATITWESDERITKCLADSVLDESVEKVKYLPQQYLDKLCNEMISDGKSSFDSEIKKVIFSHIAVDKRLNYETFDQLLLSKTKVINEEIKIYRDEISNINTNLHELENKLTDSYSNLLNEKLIAKKAELEQLNKIKPSEVQKPENGEDNAEAQTLSLEVSQINDRRQALEKKKEIHNEEKAELNRKEESIKTLIGKLDNFTLVYERLKKECKEHLEIIDNSFDNLIKLEVNKDELTLLQKSIDERLITINSFIDGEVDDSYKVQARKLDKELLEIKGKLDMPNKLYQEYLRELDLWQEKSKEIIGDEQTPETIMYLENQILELTTTVPQRIASYKEERLDKTRLIFEKIQELIATYKGLYLPVQNTISVHPIVKEKYQLKFDVSVKLNTFVEDFFKIVGHTRGSFYGADEGKRRVNDIIDKQSYNGYDDIITFINEIILNLETDQRDNAAQSSMEIDSQLRKGMTRVDLYNYLYSLKYLIPNYALTLGEKELDKLSPGEKGALLLMFYLLVDLDDRPLIIDQPEENLDNQSVYELLVPCIKEAKNRRQIIIVTHNPNLAVVCDAEQVIYSSIDKPNGNKVTYVAGAIENPDINSKIVDILEGTWPAFDNRTNKYLVVI